MHRHTRTTYNGEQVAEWTDTQQTLGSQRGTKLSVEIRVDSDSICNSFFTTAAAATNNNMTRWK